MLCIYNSAILCSDVCVDCGYGQTISLTNMLSFLLDSSEDYEPKGHGWHRTIMVSLANRLTAKCVQGLK